MLIREGGGESKLRGLATSGLAEGVYRNSSCIKCYMKICVIPKIDMNLEISLYSTTWKN